MSDKKTIGLTLENRRVMEHLIEKNLFHDGLAAAKFALAFAIKSDANPVSLEGVETIWNVGSFDQEGELRNLIPVLFPDVETPYRFIEELMNIGFSLLGDLVKVKKNLDVISIMAINSS